MPADFVAGAAVAVGVTGGAEVGGVVVGGAVVGGVVVGGAVVGGAVVGGLVGVGDLVGAGDFDGVGDLVGVGDFDGVGAPVVLATWVPATLTGLPLPRLPAERVVLVCALARGPAGCAWVWVGSTVLLPTFSTVVLPLFEIRTAMMATAPMPAAPMAASRKGFWLPGRRGAGPRWGAVW